ncbi:glycosyltransferase family 2 protein [Lutibacter maritimus]|uniref:Glycosyl transferase family 2 n=1 Tax=Lutibacter maritimus TaxID=593133 RepID=A0A1I6QMM9_9FLAO|nr:glycosyltransferase [Lutibacter maritimus]SFS53683.1 Glycosyl transferase family 2 [Lutibacter maritimus]
MTTLSIIIPVFNGEKVIKRCLESIFSQTDFSFIVDVIVVNDGSLDNSWAILKGYELLHPNLLIVNQVNSGTGAARNVGLEIAKGDFIWFIDSDDYIQQGAFKVIEKYFFNSGEKNTFAFNYFKRNNRDEINIPDKQIIHKGFEVFSGVNFINPSSNKPYFLWVLLFDKKTIDTFNVRFINGIKNLEDLEFSIKYFIHANKVVYINQRLYNYCENETSTSRNLTKSNLVKIAKDTLIVHQSIKKTTCTISNLVSKQIVTDILDKSIIGFFYSLFKFDYSFSEVKYYYSIYLNNTLLPTNIKSANFKFFIFEKFVNSKMLFLTVSFFKKLKTK